MYAASNSNQRGWGSLCPTCSYARFLALHAKHPEAVLVPTADIALMWHTHLANSRQYSEACLELFGQSDAAHLWRPSYLWLQPEQWWAGYVATKGLFEATYGKACDWRAPGHMTCMCARGLRGRHLMWPWTWGTHAARPCCASNRAMPEQQHTAWSLAALVQ